MIRFYAYYSFGGYKDMALGSQKLEAPKTYYLPLLESMLHDNDSKLSKKAKRQEGLPKIGIISDSDRYGAPLSLTRLISNGGYELFFSKHFDGCSILVIRDIRSSERDSSGRPIPFAMSLIGDIDDDAMVMSKICAYVMMNWTTARHQLASFIYYDPQENGLCFANGKMNQWIEHISRWDIQPVRIGGSTEINLSEISNDLIISGQPKQVIAHRLGLSPRVLTVIPDCCIWPIDNRPLAQKRCEQYMARCREQHKRTVIAYTKAAGAIALGVGAALLIAALVQKQRR